MIALSTSLKWVSILSVLLILGLYSGLASARDEVCVYDQRDWKGDRFCTSESIRNLADEDWNDDIASIEVDEGIEVILYEDSNFRGQSLRVMEDADHIRHARYAASDGWKLQQYCNCKTNKRCYIRQANGKREVGECLFDCPQGCK